MREKLRYFAYPQKGFVALVWIIAAMCVMIHIGLTHRLSTLVPQWEESMAAERQELQQQINVLERHIKDNGGQFFDRTN